MNLFKDIKGQLSKEEELALYEGILAKIISDFQSDDVDQLEKFGKSAVNFAVCMVAQACTWHLEDHEGYECVRDSIPKITADFEEYLILACQFGARKGGFKDPFAELSVNEKLVKEMLNKSDS